MPKTFEELTSLIQENPKLKSLKLDSKGKIEDYLGVDSLLGDFAN